MGDPRELLFDILDEDDQVIRVRMIEADRDEQHDEATTAERDRILAILAGMRRGIEETENRWGGLYARGWNNALAAAIEKIKEADDD